MKMLFRESDDIRKSLKTLKRPPATAMLLLKTYIESDPQYSFVQSSGSDCLLAQK